MPPDIENKLYKPGPTHSFNEFRTNVAARTADEFEKHEEAVQALLSVDEPTASELDTKPTPAIELGDTQPINAIDPEDDSLPTFEKIRAEIDDDDELDEWWQK